MKIIRTKRTVTIGDRTKRQAIVAIAITDWTFQEQLNRFKALVTDFEVIDNVNPEPGKSLEPGSPLKIYTPISNQPKTVIRKPAEVNGIFDFFAIPIEPGDDYTLKLRDLIVKGLLLDTQQNPIYDTTADDWEIIDTDDEIAV